MLQEDTGESADDWSDDDHFDGRRLSALRVQMHARLRICYASVQIICMRVFSDQI